MMKLPATGIGLDTLRTVSLRIKELISSIQVVSHYVSPAGKRYENISGFVV
jgi:hypothetical protein